MFRNHSSSSRRTDILGELGLFPQPPVDILKLISVTIHKDLAAFLEAVLEIRLIVADHRRAQQIRVEAALI